MKTRINLHTDYKYFFYFIFLILIIIICWMMYLKKNNLNSVDYVNAIELPQENSKQLTKPYRIDSKPNIYAESAILIDADSKYTLYQKNSTTPKPIASTTKLITSIVAIENFNLTDILTVDDKSASINGSQMNLIKEENITVKDLLKGLLVVSGNDAAYTLANSFNKGEKKGFDAFVEEMNNKARSLNLKNAHFTDPAGLDDSAETSAKDLAIIADEFLKNDQLLKIVKISEEVVYDTKKTTKHTLKNSNRLVLPNEKLYMPEALGIKTGFTGEAGHCLVSAIEYKNHRLISVILNTNSSTPPASAEESYKLLQWGKNQIDLIEN